MSGQSWGRDVFDRLYGADPDPWRFDSSAYEAGKYADTLAQLGDGRFSSALELGCGNGAMSMQLIERCDALLAVDISPNALALAKRRCVDRPGIAFREAVMPGGFADLPAGPFDLVVISELLYFLSPSDVSDLAGRIAGVLADRALVLLVNWTGETDTPCTGDAAAERFVDALGALGRFETRLLRRDAYRIDGLRRNMR
ncbi:nodulation S family protein [Acetobacteraceae bacterium KSS8]|uniref:Nodulation S family protein n=1 Tax=Endosaccharibacter trunci TaxID=2812733 RepID=A0ABT1W8Y3_9PROT|nr:nodulation S family protein [Acetobacteraceae bacterium KSS8]